jgi:predicted MPP superfamily phosphohydrolase
MKISVAHISDLHLSSKEALEIFELLATDIQSVKPLPVLIIVTGDLVDQPGAGVLRRARERLRKLCEDCKIDPEERLIVIPGNHDYRHFGVFGMKEAVKETAFNRTFPNWQLPRFFDFDGRCFALFCLDSNTNDPRINLARGRVGQSEYQRFERDYEELHKRYKSAFEESFKVALLHHHPLPIAETEVDELTGNDAFLALDDAGTLITEMIHKEVDLVLHGHKHCPLFARTKFMTTDRGERELTVLAAGSASKPNPGRFGNAYNLITVMSEGPIEVEQRYRDAPLGGFKPRHQKPIPILGYESFRDRSYEISLLSAHFSVGSETHSYLINEFGDSECNVEFRNLRVRGKKPLEYFPEELKTTAGTIRGFRAFSKTDTMPHPDWCPDPSCDDKVCKGEIRFKSPIVNESGPISFDTTYYHFNGFALNEQQSWRMYGDHDPEHHKFLVAYPIRTLFITISFPSHISAPSFALLVRNNKGERNILEETYCRQYLHVSELTRSLTLVIPKPLQFQNYTISWRPEPQAENLPPGPKGTAKVIRKKLLDLNLRTQLAAVKVHPLQSVFEGIRLELLERYPSDYFDIGLMVYDEQIKRLRHVAGVMQQEYWGYQLHEGEGVAGRAHKLDFALLYVRDRVQAEMDWYATPPASIAPHEVVFAVPLRYPLPVGQPIGAAQASVIGVLWIGSTAPGSSLLRLYDRPEEGDELISIFHEDYFLRRILPTINPLEVS